MKVRHDTVTGYTITTTYQQGLVYHEQHDEYDHDNEWVSSVTVMEGLPSAEAYYNLEKTGDD